jgi:hypothetical protein
VNRACPTHLLEKPATEGHGCFGGGDGVRNKSNAVAEEEKTGGEMSVFVDDLVAVSNMAMSTKTERLTIQCPHTVCLYHANNSARNVSIRNTAQGPL